jgi:PncC family amidohydrolase
MDAYERLLHDLLLKKKFSLSLAESCTGGAFGASLVKFDNASQYFLGSVVAYSNFSKIKILGVNAQTLLHFGAVSEETAIEMTQGCLKLFNSDFSVSVTGIAGPLGGSDTKPVGTIFFAIDGRQSYHWKEFFEGSREEIISKCVQSACKNLYKILH